jgi:hypothetical protein
MEDLVVKQQLINEAIKLHKKIFPVGRKTTLDECFTRQDNKLLLWFNKEDNSTKVLVHEFPNDTHTTTFQAS